MTKLKDISVFIIQNIESHSSDISRLTQRKFNVSRQAVNHHLRKLAEEGKIKAVGKTRQRKYELLPTERVSLTLRVNSDLKEDEVWRNRVSAYPGEISRLFGLKKAGCSGKSATLLVALD